ncbi:hypothetical protein ACJMK2_004855 [Sinanodonta woodiana]|uniref:RNA helicase n=1 Tax=Sinanodonta woodiana TaxID=1069815 RepID=A0ABD3VQW4_SINWO
MAADSLSSNVSEAMSLPDETTIKFYLQAFLPMISETVDCNILLMRLNVLNSAERKEIFNLNKSGGKQAEATRRFLEKILENDEPGIYRELHDVLQEDYQRIANVLRFGHIPKDQRSKERTLQLFMKEIVNRLNPRDVLPSLFSEGVIIKSEYEQIKAEIDKGPTSTAVMSLVFSIPCHIEKWYEVFLICLYENDSEDLAEIIDKDFIEDYKNKKVSKQGKYVKKKGKCKDLQLNVDQMETEESENVVSYFQEADSSGDLGAIPNFEEYSISSDTYGLSMPTARGEPDGQLAGLPSHESPSSSTAAQSSSVTMETVTMECHSENTERKLLLHEGSEEMQVSFTPDANQYLQGPLQNNHRQEKNGLKDKVEDASDTELNLEIDENEDESEDTEMEDQVIKLREYQKELARPALEGKNVIIVAPTGSGKTMVALRIIQEHITRKRGREIPKVIFLVNQVALANQQGDACKKHLTTYNTQVISGEVQRNMKVSLKDFIDKRNILVVTAQVLLDALVYKEIESITRFSLMIFDECHHCHAKHTFNQIMSYYMDVKLANSTDRLSLPQIVGLTASVGVGKSRNIAQAKTHIKKLMANLDAEEISTVCNNIGELSEYVSVPTEEIMTVEKRENDVFGQSITETMNKIEDIMEHCDALQKVENPEQYMAVLKAPASKGSDQYTQWASKLWKETAKIREPDVRRFINPCRNHLQIYNETLIIYNDARTRDAIDYMKQEISVWKQSAIMDKNEQCLQALYERLEKPEFVERVQNLPNPKLQALGKMIIKGFKGKEPADSRGIIFVKTRNLAKAITAWLKDTPDLKSLNPIEFVGSNTSGGKAMTKAEQVDALKYFRDGKHKLIVATSVAEEGLDISQCNLVIRYDHVTNEIAMVQSRGRGRAQDSQYMVLAEEGKGTAEKEELNMIREIMMRKAIIQLQQDIASNPGKVKEELKQHQDDEQLTRRLEAKNRKGRLMRMGDFELRCFKCDEYICMSTDIKKVQNAHHVVVLDDFEDRVKITKTGSRRVIDETIQFVGRLNCKKCGNDMGTVGIHRNLEFPVIKISSFIIVDTNSRQSTCTKWNKAPFEVLALTNDDFKMLLDKRGEDPAL